MPTLSAAALKARINALQKQLAAAENKKIPAIKKVTALMKKLGVTVADLQNPTPAGRGRRGRPPGKANGKGNGGARSSKRAGRKVAIKYRDDKGNTWTGRGKTPRWLVAAEKSGKHRDQFKIQ
jgi:DNA-binding protein H-NS